MCVKIYRFAYHFYTTAWKKQKQKQKIDTLNIYKNTFISIESILYNDNLNIKHQNTILFVITLKKAIKILFLYIKQ